MLAISLLIKVRATMMLFNIFYTSLIYISSCPLLQMLSSAPIHPAIAPKRIAPGLSALSRAFSDTFIRLQCVWGDSSASLRIRARRPYESLPIQRRPCPDVPFSSSSAGDGPYLFQSECPLPIEFNLPFLLIKSSISRYSRPWLI